MSTIDRPLETSVAVPTAAPPRRRYGLLLVVALFALVLGTAVGWVARGSDGDPEAMVAGGGSLTDRQEQMVAVASDLTAAWQAGDGAAVVALMTPTGTFQLFGTDTVYRADDGTLAAYVESDQVSSLEMLTPYLVYGDTVMAVFTVATSPALSALTFTSDGDVLVATHVLHNVFGS